MDVSFHGPMTEDEKAALDCVIEHRDGIQGLLDYIAAEIPNRPKKNRMFLEGILPEIQKKFDAINDNLPKRFRTVLKNRVVGR